MTGSLLAKSSGETLSAHTVWCLSAAKALLESLPFDLRKAYPDLQADVLTSVALHDVGKAAVGFQKMLRGEQKSWDGKRHEVLSAAFASKLPSVSQARSVGYNHASQVDPGRRPFKFQ